MRKIFLLLLVTVFNSCSKPDDATSTPTVAEPSILLEAKAPVLDFYGVPNKTAANIQVYDYVKVVLEISKLKGASIISVSPEGISATFHDILNTDYELYMQSATEPGKYVKVESLIMEEGKNVFYVKPLVPGTFQIKLVEKTKTFQLDSPVVFSAVSISTSTESSLKGNCGFSRWRHKDYYFKVDGGSQTFDKLLVDSNATFSYETSYFNTSFAGSFAAKTDLKVIDTKAQCGDYPETPALINSITIKKTINNVTETIAIYYNIPIQ